MMVSSPFGGRPAPGGLPRLPTPPTGWPIGSYATYGEAQQAVDFLADSEFSVGDVTIVGVDLMLVERVIGKLQLGPGARHRRRLRAPGSACSRGCCSGLFVNQGFALQVLTGLVLGVLSGLMFAAIGYSMSRGRRDFSSASQLVAGRYDVLCQPRTAEQARELLAKLALKPPPANI